MQNNTEEIYAFIKDGIVVNSVIFNNPSEELLAFFKAEHGVDDIVNSYNNPNAAIGASYDGVGFTMPCPHTGWVLQNYEWLPPQPYPSDGKPYRWNNDTIQWEEIFPPEGVLNGQDIIHEQ